MKKLTPEDQRQLHLDLLLSVVYARDPLIAEHLADLRKSGLSDETIERQCFRSIPPHMIDHLTGFPTPKVVSAYIIPFADPRGGWLDHVRMRIFPALTTKQGTIKYLQPRRSDIRPYFPVATLDRVLHSDESLWAVEGEKKAVAVAQLGFPAIGFCGVEGWHRKGSLDLLDDFAQIPLAGRIVELVPDGDIATNPNVRRAIDRFAQALTRRGAHPRLVTLPVAA